MASPLQEQIHHLIHNKKLTEQRKLLEAKRAQLESEISKNPTTEELQLKLLEIDHDLDKFEDFSNESPESLRLALAQELSTLDDPIDIKEYNEALKNYDQLTALEKNLKLISDHLQVILNARTRIKKRGIFSYILSVSPNTYIEQTLIALEKFIPKVESKNALPNLEQSLTKLEEFVKAKWSFKTIDQNVESFQQEVEGYLSELQLEMSAQLAMIRAEEAQLDRQIEEKGLLN